jgi:glycerol-3-phosphate dehydrogenase
VTDALTGGEIEIRAKVTVNAAGAHAGEVMKLFGVARELPLLKAINLVTSRPASDMALAAKSASGAMLTMTPWHGRAMVGTFQSAALAQPADLAVTEPEIEAAVADANYAFPALKLTRPDVTLVHRGIVPASALPVSAGPAPAGQAASARAQLLSRSQIFDHAADGASGAITLIGVKYTTARAAGARAAEAAVRRLGAPSLQARRQATDILPGAGIADHEALTIETARAVGLELAPPIIRHLNAIYGDRSAAIVRIMAEQTDWRMPLVGGRPNVGAEIIHAIRHEMAMTLADIVIRRSELGAMAYPGDDIVAAAARIAAEELGWDAARRDREIGEVAAFYRIA